VCMCVCVCVRVSCRQYNCPEHPTSIILLLRSFNFMIAVFVCVNNVWVVCVWVGACVVRCVGGYICGHVCACVCMCVVSVHVCVKMFLYV